MGLTFCEGQKTYKWYGRWMKDYNATDAAYHHGFDPAKYGQCEHAIKVPGSKYEIGVTRKTDGSLGLIYDFFGSEGRVITDKLGKGLESLRQQYATRVVVAKQQRAGWRVQEQKLSDGSIRVVCTR